MSNRIPRATYRLQLHPSFDFDRAIEVLDYVAELGASHCYFAPYLTATRGSSHGYDVVDPARVREDLGGEAGHARLCAALKARGLEQMVDVVPNHMGIDSDDNAWWWDVLEKGPTSPFAHFFDIEWNADLDGKVVLPILPSEEGTALASGHVRLGRNEQGKVVVLVGERALPLCEASFSSGLEACSDAGTDSWMQRVNGYPIELAQLLEKQFYKLVYWRTGLGIVNYRRFLDISSLAAIRVEDAHVFQSTHRRILDWVRDGLVSGIRVDHPDGLTDPEGYFQALRKAAPEAWIVGEKVLSPGEWLPENWAVDGTTGYDFLNLINGLFVDPNGAEGMDAALEAFLGRTPPTFGTICSESKRLVLNDLLQPEINRVVRLLQKRTQDSNASIEVEQTRRAVLELALALDVGRSYARPGKELSAQEQADLDRAAARATAECPELDHAIARVVDQLSHVPVDELCLRFQQLTCAAMAKGIEDTALYRYGRLTSLNEIGGNPERFGHSLREFHQYCARATMAQPLSLLSTSTHDTKRAEDTRLRISALSEIPSAWQAAVQTWSELNANLADPLLDKGTEYLLYQTLVGTWPITPERLVAYMRKAIREAKQYTSWLAPYVAYETAVSDFAVALLKNADFLQSLESFLVPVLRASRIHALTQTLLKLTAPGIPDVYQGTELYDTSLVDPDNRRPVSFAERRAMLGELKRGMSPELIMARLDEGLPKLWVLYQGLQLRRERPEILTPTSSYEPIHVDADPLDSVVALLRSGECLAVGQRLFLASERAKYEPRITIPKGDWLNRLTGERVASGTVEVSALCSRFPVALLVKS